MGSGNTGNVTSLLYYYKNECDHSGITVADPGIAGGGIDAECEARRADARGPKGRERGGVLGEGAAAPSPPARESGGAL